MTNLTKGLISLSTIGAATGGGILIKNKLSSEVKRISISQRLTQEGYTFLNAANDAEWGTTLEKHKSDQIKHPKFQLSSSNLRELQEVCKSELMKTEYSEDDYKKAKKWCVKPISVRELIKAKNKNLLDVDKSGEENKEEWKKLSDQYEATGKGDKAIEGLTIPPSSGKTENDWKQLRTKCKELADKDFWSDKYDEELDKAIMWCTSKYNGSI
ncbi:hypothetical protein MHC_01840 [Mycoplasma haemocanis str. Illinois]|uniref:Uncharacterized protein n=1 Tax=Mycoplasma haemocanis (strain Illinois) TaxID=1111676 RepID=H6N6G2_MYCHN|nr:hypothetical protein [Mycoplasma haemocanis]AEW45234.1 hypothetical protein MHC_01840 [Mycoplasma haemocanis str. Illinois]